MEVDKVIINAESVLQGRIFTQGPILQKKEAMKL